MFSMFISEPPAGVMQQERNNCFVFHNMHAFDVSDDYHGVLLRTWKARRGCLVSPFPIMSPRLPGRAALHLHFAASEKSDLTELDMLTQVLTRAAVISRLDYSHGMKLHQLLCCASTEFLKC